MVKKHHQKCRVAFVEVRRKLLLALETTNKQDRDVVCAEVFADITGRLNKKLQVGCFLEPKRSSVGTKPTHNTVESFRETGSLRGWSTAEYESLDVG
jgi:hypothetical protein